MKNKKAHQSQVRLTFVFRYKNFSKNNNAHTLLTLVEKTLSRLADTAGLIPLGNSLLTAFYRHKLCRIWMLDSAAACIMELAALGIQKIAGSISRPHAHQHQHNSKYNDQFFHNKISLRCSQIISTHENHPFSHIATN